MRILVTGGAGYIGSHAAKRLLKEGHSVVIVDDLSRGRLGAIDRLRAIGGDRLTFERAGVGERERMAALLRDHAIEAVMHFAALAYVGESVERPLDYYANNTGAALELLRACGETSVPRFVFSSTCATYGEPAPHHIPIDETCPQRPINPYGRSKLFFEQALADHAQACARDERAFSCARLRYFNVAGADLEGDLGEDHDPETHLIPIVLEAALGKREAIEIHGTDYPTADGTCLRDYIHVDDLVDAHVAALDALEPSPERSDVRTYNLGIGRGVSVLEVIETARRVTGREIRAVEGPRRAGDPPTLFANPSRIERELGWRARITDLETMIESAWRWMQANPNGYAKQ